MKFNLLFFSSALFSSFQRCSPLATEICFVSIFFLRTDMLCRSLARVNIPHSMINWFWFYHKDQTASIHYLLSLIFFRLFCLIFGSFFIVRASGFYLQPFRLVSYSFMNFWLRKIKVNHVAELFDNGKKVQRKIFCIFVSSGF